jgi:hypothetical protein
MSDGILASTISLKVDRLFAVDRKKYHGQRRQIPVVGGSYVPGEDNIKPMKKLARAALLAREWSPFMVQQMHLRSPFQWASAKA